MKRKIPEGLSLQVYVNGQLYFTSAGKWLYPLFDLEVFMKNHPVDFSQANVVDKVIGKAAALFLVHLGAGRVHGELMSALAIDTLNNFHIPYTFNTKVPRIDCKTEELLLSINNPEIAYQLISKRAKRNF